MPGPRQPTDLLKATGRKHLSRAEEAARRSREARVEPAKTAKPPKWLPEWMKKDFRTLGKRLIAAGLYTDLDADVLGRYLMAQHGWVAASREAADALEPHPGPLLQAGPGVRQRHGPDHHQPLPPGGPGDFEAEGGRQSLPPAH